MKNLKFIVLFLAIFSAILLFPHPSLAATPNLSLSSLGNNSVQVTVNGDANSTVNLYYYPIGSGGQISVGSIGSTNSSGYFTNTIYNGTYNIPSGSNTYVLINGQQSNTAQWPYNNGNGNGGQISFSQNNITLGYGQSLTVTIYGGNGSYYISSNSNSNYINATISGNQLYLSQPTSQYVGGSATITVCSNNGGGCGTLYVSQNGSNNGYQQISFSQSNVNVNIGQGQQVTIYGAGSFYVSNNSNPNIVSTNLNGNVINLYGNQYGSSNVIVCSYGGNSNCGTLYVNVTNNGGYYNQGYNNTPIVYTQNPITPTYYPSGYGTPSAGVFLNQVPSTGVSMDLKTILFFLGLFMWSAFGAFMIISHRKYQRILAEIR